MYCVSISSNDLLLLRARISISPSTPTGWHSSFTPIRSIPPRVFANAIVVSGNYFFPTNSNAKYGIGAGVGYYMVGGEAEDGTTSLTTDVSGSTVGFHFMGLAEWTVSPGFAITGGAGYRIANVGDTQFDETSTDPETETDYSGFMARAGLAFYMPSK